MDFKPSRTIGECVFCFGESGAPLTKEHIIPRALHINFHGKNVPEWVLKDGACKTCQGKTQRYEGLVLESMRPLREALSLKTRKGYPQEAVLQTTRNNEQSLVTLPKEQAWKMAGLPEYRMPGVIDERENTSSLVGQFGVFHQGESPSEAASRLGVDRVGLPGIFEVGASDADLEVYDKFRSYYFGFARMVGKIAYCITVYHFGIGTIVDKAFIRCILGESDNIGYFVGCNPNLSLSGRDPRLTTNHYNCVARIGIWHEVILVRLKLFFLTRNVPEYVVAVGPASPLLAHLLSSIGYGLTIDESGIHNALSN